jgi:divalent metal cation (Fe/Co/Zn/Cd) transporter
MFGHGRVQNVAVLLAATLFLSFSSYKFYKEAILKLIHPASLSHENLPLAIGLLVFSLIIVIIIQASVIL